VTWPSPGGPQHGGIFRDFIVGIEAHPTDAGGLLADTKYAYDTNRELPKILAAHASYGRVLLDRPSHLSLAQDYWPAGRFANSQEQNQ
jgi:hypothetical protein